MTPRERMLRTLTCQETDRAPLPYWLGFFLWGDTHERWKKESGLEDLNLYDMFDFEPFCHWVHVNQGPLPEFESEVIEETDEFVISIDGRGIKVRNRRDYGSMPEFLEHPVKTPDDWQRYKEERLQGSIDDRLPDLDAKAADIAKAYDDAPVQVGNFPWGVFGTIRDLLGAEEVLYAFYDEPEMIHDMMDTLTTLWLDSFEKVAEKIQIDHIHIWEDMAGRSGSLISTDMMEEFMMPQYDRFAAFAKKHNVAVISVDSDGHVDQIVPVMTQHGVNAFFPFEVQAGNDIREFRKQFPDLCIIGGIDKNALAKDKAALHEELDRVAFMLEHPGYIPGFDHLIPPDASWENFVYFMNEMIKMIGK
jgi:uroporphyrinogen decarboxylase